MFEFQIVRLWQKISDSCDYLENVVVDLKNVCYCGENIVVDLHIFVHTFVVDLGIVKVGLYFRFLWVPCA